MELTRPLLFWDVEGTGLDTQQDAIWQFGYFCINPDGSTRRSSKRFRPWKPLSPEVEELCKVKTSDLETEDPFADHVVKILLFMSGKDLAGYNLRQYDLPLLDEEARRSGLKVDISGVRIIDSLTIFRKKHGRSLTDAVRFYCGDHEAEGFAAMAHDAGTDAEWTSNVFRKQIEAYPDLSEMTVDQLAAFCQSDVEYVDLAGKLYRDRDGDVCFAFGKENGKKVRDAVGYARWMQKQSFPGSTMDALEVELRRLGQ